MENDDRVIKSSSRRLQLGRFLRECRERIGPQAVGLPMTQRRRTPGLRREEVAALAGISTTYYTKIEQGRVLVSDRVLDALAGVLRLNHTEREYAMALARGGAARDIARPEAVVSPALRLFLEQQESFPVLILNRRWDYVAWNQAACAALLDLEAIPVEMRNLLIMTFLVPQSRQILVDWETQARRLIAEFRADYGRYHNDPAFHELIALLTANSAEFKQWWAELSRVGSVSEAEMNINHPAAGPMSFLETALMVYDHPGLRVMLFLPQDDATKEKLQTLYDARMAARAAAPGPGEQQRD